MILKEKDVVVAKRVLLDREYKDGGWWIIVKPGHIGVINDCGQKPPLYDVVWETGNRCTVHEFDIEPYTGDVDSIVD